MIFKKNSTRTRVAFETAMVTLGGHAIFLSSDTTQITRGEDLSDTAKVLSGMVDIVMIRTHNHSEVEELASNSSVPIINGLTEKYHPCQLLADIYKINNDLEKAIKYQRLQLKYINSNLDKAYANINIAKLSSKMGDEKSALSLIEQIIDENSDNFDIIKLAEQANGVILAK